MREFFGDMLPYEIIMAVMGIVIFLASVFLLVWMVMKKRGVAVLIPFFLISVVMVAFPTLSSVKVGDFLIDIREKTVLVETDPTDSEAVNQLSELLDKLDKSGRLSNNSEALVAAANAEIALGKYKSASEKLEKAEEINSETKGLMKTKGLIRAKIEIEEDFIKDIGQLNLAISQLEASPEKEDMKVKIAEKLSNIRIPDYVDPKELSTIAKSYAVIGQQATSLQVIDKIEPQISASGDEGLIKLRDSIEQSISLSNGRPLDSARILKQSSRPVGINQFEKTIVRPRLR